MCASTVRRRLLFSRLKRSHSLRPNELGHLRLGLLGELLAERYLRERGHAIIATNVRLPFGELDLVTRDGDRIVFVEVKTRQSSSRVDPLVNVGFEKSERLHRLARAYLRAHFGSTPPLYRVDLVAVAVDPLHLPRSLIRHLPGAG